MPIAHIFKMLLLRAHVHMDKKKIISTTHVPTYVQPLLGKIYALLISNFFFSIQGWSRRLGTAHRIITVVWCRSTYVYVVQPYNLPLKSKRYLRNFIYLSNYSIVPYDEREVAVLLKQYYIKKKDFFPSSRIGYIIACYSPIEHILSLLEDFLERVFFF